MCKYVTLVCNQETYVPIRSVSSCSIKWDLFFIHLFETSLGKHHKCIYIYMYICTCIYTYIYAHMLVYICVYIKVIAHSHIYILFLLIYILCSRFCLFFHVILYIAYIIYRPMHRYIKKYRYLAMTIHMSDMASCVWLVCVTWIIHMCNTTHECDVIRDHNL